MLLYPPPHTRLTPMFTNRKRNRENDTFLPASLRRQTPRYASPYYHTETELRARMTTAPILRPRRPLRNSRRPRAPRSAAAELTRRSNRRTFLESLLFVLFHPAALFRRPRFLQRNKRRRTHPLRRAKLPQSI